MRLVRVCVLVAAAAATAGAAGAQDHGYTPADIENGGRLFQSSCAGCHGVDGAGVSGVELARGQFRRGTSDTELMKIIQGGIPGTTMPPHNFTDAQAASIVAYLRNMATVRTGAAPTILRGVGDATRGKALFEGKGQCTTCHRVNGQGGPTGMAPDLGDAGAQRTALSLQMSILEPSSAMMPINRTVRIVTKDGKTIVGRRLNEDTYSVQLINEQGRLQSILKSDVKQYQINPASPMPPFKDKLTTEEIADLVAYLLSLRG
jgi:cytochrome c oxidase cbb3-type subunit 3